MFLALSQNKQDKTFLIGNIMNIFSKAFGRERTANIRKKEIKELFTERTTPEYLKYNQLAVNAYNSQNCNEALFYINKAIEVRDRDVWVLFAFKANVLEDLGKYQEAIKEYERAIDYAEDDIIVYAQYHQIGFCYTSLGNYQKAVQFFTYALELKKQHPNNSFNIDIEGFKDGVMYGVEFKRIYNNRGNALKNLDRLQEALEDCQQAISYDPNYSNPFLLLAQILSKAGQESRALEYLKYAASLGNQNAQRDLIRLGYL